MNEIAAKWNIGPEHLGYALFEPIVLAPQDLDDAGVIEIDERLLVSFFVRAHFGAEHIDALHPKSEAAFEIGILYEPISDEDMRCVEAELEIEGTANEVCERLRLAIQESYEKARETLYPAGHSDDAPVRADSATS